MLPAPHTAVGSRLCILSAAVLWSTAGAAIKLSNLTSWQISGGRSVVAALVLFLLFPEARVRPSRTVAWVALAYAMTVTLFVVANKLTTAANAIFIQDAAPLYVLILSPWLLKESPTRSELMAVPIYVVGILLFFVDQLTPGQVQGNLVALGSGVAFAFSIMGLRLLRGGGTNAATAWGNLLAFLVCLPLAVGGPAPTTTDVGIVLFLGVFQLGLAYALFGLGLQRTSAVEASLLILLEPVLNAVWAFLFAHETPGPWAVVGGAIVLLATAWRTLSSTRTRTVVAQTDAVG
ncbi:MAG: EamA family transporter [Myxococcota bacterium]